MSPPLLHLGCRHRGQTSWYRMLNYSICTTLIIYN
nr:MAG TPA: hypothetical protein [Caudoviricetes sp.]